MLFRIPRPARVRLGETTGSFRVPVSLSAGHHPLAERRDLIHGEISQAEPAASRALLALAVQPLRLRGGFVDGEVGHRGGDLEVDVAPGAMFVEAEVLGAAANVADQVHYRSVREKARHDVFHRLEIVGRDVLIEQEEKDTAHLKGAKFPGSQRVCKVDGFLERRPDIVRTV